jgi:glyceraldehyde-3-phosphate dehydrogenase (NAD(P))
VAADNVPLYRARGLKFILQGGEKHAVTGHSFVAEANFETAVGRQSTRVVSCNTTATVRTLGALKRAGLLLRARGVLLRRATDPWESHLGGIMNTLVPEPEIPSHQGPDAQTVDPDLDVVTMAVKELMADRGRSRSDLHEVALWADMLTVQGDELFYAYMVDNQAIVVPETIDAIRALDGRETSGRRSIAATDLAMGIDNDLFAGKRVWTSETPLPEVDL